MIFCVSGALKYDQSLSLVVEYIKPGFKWKRIQKCIEEERVKLTQYRPNLKQ